MGKPAPYKSKDLTKHLKQIAAEAHDWSAEDGMITKGEALSRLLWQKALGWTETQVDDEGNEKQVHHKPEAWAAQFMFDRIEGKAPQTISEEEDRKRKTKDTVRDLAQNRVNDLAAKAVQSDSSSLKDKGPPKRKKGDSDEGQDTPQDS